ncbi:DMT family transporter [Rhodovulum sp. DZ06]|uniref:DMT family transporter n=1 Tax=Rhodovulum sp. DZ06 TaxID=3425126 RepID=UPI003D353023
MTVSNRAWAELGILSCVWAASFLATHAALAGLGPVTLVALRLGGAALALWAWIALRGLAGPRGLRAWAALAVMGLLNNAVPFFLITWGQQSIETGLAAILNASTALFGALVAALLLAEERLTLRRAAGVGVGFCGVIAAVGPGALSGLDPRSLGQLAVVGAALSYAFASVWARVRLSGLHPAAAAAGMTTCGALWTWPAALMLEGTPDLSLSAGAAAGTLWLALPGTAGAYLLYYRVLGMAGPANLMLVTMIIPPLAILIGAAVLGEALGPGAFLGMGLILAGLAIIDGRLAAWLRGRAGTRARG